MYKAIHRIETQKKQGDVYARTVIEPNTVFETIDNVEALLDAGAIVAYEVPEITVLQLATPIEAAAKKSKKAEKPADAPDFG